MPDTVLLHVPLTCQAAKAIFWLFVNGLCFGVPTVALAILRHLEFGLVWFFNSRFYPFKLVIFPYFPTCSNMFHITRLVPVVSIFQTVPAAGRRWTTSSRIQNLQSSTSQRRGMLRGRFRSSERSARHIRKKSGISWEGGNNNYNIYIYIYM